MEKKILVLASNGVEEMELVTVIDILRRAGVSVRLFSITDSMELTGSHQIHIIADEKLENQEPDVYDGVILPGGQPNSGTLRDDIRVIQLLQSFHQKGKLVAAICAAPCALEKAGLLQGIPATSYPGCIDEKECQYKEEPVVCVGNIITSRAPGTAIAFSFAVLEYLGLKDEMNQTKKAMLVS